MVNCKQCGAKQIPYPIWKDQETGEPFSFDKINWKNLIIGNWINTFILIALLFLIWSYSHDNEECINLLNNPCDFITKNTRACSTIEQQNYPIPIEYDTRGNVPIIKLPGD